MSSGVSPASTAPSVSWILGLESLPGHVDSGSTALRWGNQTRTYAELRSRSLGLASGLRQLGLEPGDRVATQFFNRGETFELYFACAYAGLTLVPIGFRLSAREVGLILDDCRPKVLFTEAELAPVAAEAVAMSQLDVALVEVGAEVSGPAYEAMSETDATFEPATTDVQMLLYTSGTTGRPKGVQMAHSSILWFAYQQATFYRNLDADSTTLLTGPMYNTAAMNEQSIPTFLVGGTVSIMPSRGWTPERLASVIDDWKVTHAVIYPSMMEPLLEHDRDQRIDLASMRFVLTGGENCPPSTLARFRGRWSHIFLAAAYGSTESGVVSIVMDEEIERRPGTVGRAFGGQVFEIRDANGQRVPAGTIGDVWTAGPAVTPGYWNAPALNAETFDGPWLKMGDLARVDEEGYLFIEGRSKDMVISKGQNVYPAEIENVLLEHAGIVDAAVIGVPDEEAGEAVCACVVVNDTAITAQDVIAFVKERLASYKKPKHVVFLDDLPRNPAAKVEKPALAALVAGSLEVAHEHA
ncbi:class I adenylate-forming enzyme family protein [Marmoricola sp. RAF53]|uniref:class I adenylate-forming enzyme family protein n=1 Tax=Marmoricola sp. RAF53 TaxID=3233059 RepID=UPI003F9A7EA2